MSGEVVRTGSRRLPTSRFPVCPLVFVALLPGCNLERDDGLSIGYAHVDREAARPEGLRSSVDAAQLLGIEPLYQVEARPDVRELRISEADPRMPLEKRVLLRLQERGDQRVLQVVLFWRPAASRASDRRDHSCGMIEAGEFCTQYVLSPNLDLQGMAHRLVSAGGWHLLDACGSSGARIPGISRPELFTVEALEEVDYDYGICSTDSEPQGLVEEVARVIREIREAAITYSQEAET